MTISHTRGNTQGVVYGLGLAFFAAYQQFKLPAVLPVLLDSYGYDRVLAGGFMSIYALAGLFFSVLIARAIERYGPTGPILFALVLFVVGAIPGVLFPQYGLVVLAGRGLEGMGFGVLAISGPVLSNASASPRQAPVVIGWSAAWIPVGQLTAAVLAPVALATLGWRLLWWLGVAGALGFVVWTLRLNAAGRVLAPSSSSSGAAAGAGETGVITPPQRASLAIAGAVFMLCSPCYFKTTER